MSRRPGTLLKLGAELVVVFAGVVIALWADAWWEDREARTRLHDNLATLADDMAAAQVELDEATASDRRGVALLEEVQDAIADRDTAAARELTEQMGDFSVRVPPVPVGTLRYILASGDMRLLGDPEIRAQLVQGLSRIELLEGFNNELATDVRRAFEVLERAEAEARLAGVEIAVYWVGNADVLGSLRTARNRLDNIADLLEVILDQAQAIEAASRAVASR